MLDRLTELKLQPNEPAQSFVSRLGAFYGLINAREFCADFDLSYAGLATGRDSEVYKLAELTGSDPALLRRATPRTDGRRIHFGDERMSSNFSTRRHLHICPECAAEDIDAHPSIAPEAAVYLRSHWLVGPLGTCPRHARPIVRIASTARNYHAYDSSLLAEGLQERLPALLDNGDRRPATEFETYGIARLDGRQAHGGLLDQLELGDVFTICSQLGRVVVGRSDSLDEMDAQGRYECLREGFRLAKGGREVLRDAFFDRLRRMHAELSSPLGYTSLLSRAYFVLLDDFGREQRFKPLYDMISNALYDVLPVGPEDKPFCGVEISHRRFYTSTAAAKEFGFNQRTFAKYALAANAAIVVGEDADFKRVWVDAIKSEDIFNSPDGFVREKQLSALGMTMRQRKAIMGAGLLLTVVPRENSGEKPPIRSADVEALMAKFLERAETVETPPPGSADMQHFGRAIVGRLREIHQLILEGKVRVWRLATEPRPYAAILLNVDEVRSHLSGEQLLNTREASKITGIAKPLLIELAAAGTIECIVETNPCSGKVRRSFTQAMCDRTRRELITAAEVARLIDRNTKTVNDDITAAGIEAVCRVRSRHGNFTAYRRSDVDKYLE